MREQSLRSMSHLTLRRRSPLSPWASIAIRVALVVGMFVFVTAVHWFERHDLKDNHDGVVDFVDVIYFTMISITTTGYGDIVPVTPGTRLFDALVVTPIRIFFVLVFVGTAYNLLIKRTWNKWLMARLQERLSGHIIVTGFGQTGSEVVRELIARGTPSERIVVIDCSAENLEEAEELGCMVMHGDATRDKSLEAVRAAAASSLIVSAGRDDTSILICLTARHLAPALNISVCIKSEDNELPARAAGATTVINPVSFAGLLLAGSTDGPAVAEYLSDLASASGRVRLLSRIVKDEECGSSLAQLTTGLGVRVERDGHRYGFWEPEVQTLRPGDVIVEIVPDQRVPG